MALQGKEYQSQSKICGLVDYNTGIAIGFIMTFVALFWVYMNFDEEERQVYFAMGGFNMLCLGMTYMLRIQLDNRIRERAIEKEKEEREKAEEKKKREMYNGRSGKEQYEEIQNLFPKKDMTPEETQAWVNSLSPEQVKNLQEKYFKDKDD